ncbi:hypothetical protein G7Z17_g5126 [Cylindrodendrum hubeiense]|uniref:Uncharacterized protein n=1 Tax=Cylindrodendrum hubeiense TaxID=595255 RepID=A0A9P5LHL7_9HYPO|nr:hypothetical protein G7Z17_g5126 [Cylindrodendrum hubeiense]
MSQSNLGSDAYMAGNASETTLVALAASPKLSLKNRLKNKLNGSVDPTQMHKRDPTKSWEARANVLKMHPTEARGYHIRLCIGGFNDIIHYDNERDDRYADSTIQLAGHGATH